MAGMISFKLYFFTFCCFDVMKSIVFHDFLLLFLSPTIQLLYYLERVNFTTTFGDQVSFDENGDALPIYDVMNWMWHPDGSTEVKNMGEVKELASKVDHLILDAEKIFWNFESKKVCYLAIFCDMLHHYIVAKYSYCT